MSRREITSASFDGLEWDAHQELPMVAGGTDEGRLMVRLDVDGQYTAVYADLGYTSALTGLRRSIAALQAVHDELTAMYGTAAPVGQCTSIGDWGRCTLEEGHGAEHAHPSQVDWAQLNDILRQAASR